MKCLIVDDDPLVCDLLEHFCFKMDMNIECTISNSGFESVNLINQGEFDVILLDFDLPDITGKDILSVIKTDTPVIMITSNKEFGYESYSYTQVIDYLVKPIMYTRFYKAIEKLILATKEPPKANTHFFLKDGTGLTKVIFDDILYIKAAGNYLEFVMPNKKVMTLMTMKDIEPRLDENFQRTHRSYIVNTNMVEKVTSGGITILDDVIPLSKTYEDTFLKKLNLLN